MPPTPFIADYALWVFLSALGVLQFVAARSALTGLLFLRRWPRPSAYLGLMLAAASLVWFFVSEFRNLPDTQTGLNGNTQALWFVLSTSAAVAVTFLASSALNHRWGAANGWDPAERSAPSGLGWLEHTTFARALLCRISAMRSRTG